MNRQDCRPHSRTLCPGAQEAVRCYGAHCLASAPPAQCAMLRQRKSL
jgi:hypothetical protein